jgi:uncharacterized protein (UPF0335 family)
MRMSETETGTLEIELEETDVEDDSEDELDGEEGGRVLVVDLEKRQSRKKIDKLREGKGPLMDKVYDVLDELRAAGYLEDAVQPVVFVVREKLRAKD